MDYKKTDGSNKTERQLISEGLPNGQSSSQFIYWLKIIALLALTSCCIFFLALAGRVFNWRIDPRSEVSASPRPPIPASAGEYIWYEAENMRGISQTPRHEPVLNPSYLDLPAAKAPGWSISGPGVSAEWSQGGESEWNSVAAAYLRRSKFHAQAISKSGCATVTGPTRQRTLSFEYSSKIASSFDTNSARRT